MTKYRVDLLVEADSISEPLLAILYPDGIDTSLKIEMIEIEVLDG